MSEESRQYQFDYTKDVLDCIENLQRLIAEQEEKIKALKGAIESNARSGLRIASEREPQAADEIATYLYWFYDKFVPSAVVCDHYGVAPQGVGKYVQQATMTVNCIDCKREFDEVLRSRSHLKDLKRSRRGVCPDCEVKRKSRTMEYANDYARIKEEHQRIVQELRALPYPEYLKSEHWKNLRTKMLKQAGYRCQVCNAKNVSLHVHHRTYANRGDEQTSDLIVLCAECHKTFHENGKVTS